MNNKYELYIHGRMFCSDGFGELLVGDTLILSWLVRHECFWYDFILLKLYGMCKRCCMTSHQETVIKSLYQHQRLQVSKILAIKDYVVIYKVNDFLCVV